MRPVVDGRLRGHGGGVECAMDERDRAVRFLRGTKHAVQPKTKEAAR
jgi:hypothetical protein